MMARLQGGWPLGEIESILRGTLANAQTSFGADAVALPPDNRSLTGADGSQSLISANTLSVGIVIGVARETDKPVFVSFGQSALMDSGIVLIPGVRPIVLLSSLSALELFAITETSGARISWQQFVRST